MQVLYGVAAAVEDACELVEGAGGAGLSADADEGGVVLHVDVVGEQEVVAGECLEHFGGDVRQGEDVGAGAEQEGVLGGAFALEGNGGDAQLELVGDGAVGDDDGVGAEVIGDFQHISLDGGELAAVEQGVGYVAEGMELCVGGHFLERRALGEDDGGGCGEGVGRGCRGLQPWVLACLVLPHGGVEALQRASGRERGGGGAEACGVEVGELVVVVEVGERGGACGVDPADGLAGLVLLVVEVCLGGDHGCGVRVADDGGDGVGAPDVVDEPAGDAARHAVGVGGCLAGEEAVLYH